MSFYRIKNKDAALRQLEQATYGITLMHYRIRSQSSKNDIVWFFTQLCADYQHAKECRDERAKHLALKRVNKWCATFESDAVTLCRYYDLIGSAKGWLQNEGVDASTIEAAECVAIDLATKEAIKKGYTGNGAW